MPAPNGTTIGRYRRLRTHTPDPSGCVVTTASIPPPRNSTLERAAVVAAHLAHHRGERGGAAQGTAGDDCVRAVGLDHRELVHDAREVTTARSADEHAGAQTRARTAAAASSHALTIDARCFDRAFERRVVVPAGPDVEHDEHRRAAPCFVLAHHQALPARGRAPVHAPQVVAGFVVAQVEELAAAVEPAVCAAACRGRDRRRRSRGAGRCRARAGTR